MTIHFIGAGPGAADLITVRGLRLIERCPVCLYAGSLVPRAVVAAAPSSARVVDTAELDLDQIIAEMAQAHAAGHDVSRVHSGDPSIYGALAEQLRRLEQLGIPYDITPGVPAFAAAAAALGVELTLPGIGQTVVLTRVSDRPGALLPAEELSRLAGQGVTLVLHLAARYAERIERDLLPAYGEACPTVIAARVSWPDEKLIRGPLAGLAGRMADSRIRRTALILVGPVLGVGQAGENSRLYAPERARDCNPAQSSS